MGSPLAHSQPASPQAPAALHIPDSKAKRSLYKAEAMRPLPHAAFPGCACGPGDVAPGGQRWGRGRGAGRSCSGSGGYRSLSWVWLGHRAGSLAITQKQKVSLLGPSSHTSACMAVPHPVGHPWPGRAGHPDRPPSSSPHCLLPALLPLPVQQPEWGWRVPTKHDSPPAQSFRAHPEAADWWAAGWGLGAASKSNPHSTRLGQGPCCIRRGPDV